VPAIDYGNIKNLFEYILKKQNKTFREEIKEERKALQDCVTEIEKSVKRSELVLERMHQEFLDSLRSRTRKFTHLISQVPKEKSAHPPRCMKFCTLTSKVC
jgi:hypothetical protein